MLVASTLSKTSLTFGVGTGTWTFCLKPTILNLIRVTHENWIMVLSMFGIMLTKSNFVRIFLSFLFWTANKICIYMYIESSFTFHICKIVGVNSNWKKEDNVFFLFPYLLIKKYRGIQIQIDYRSRLIKIYKRIWHPHLLSRFCKDELNLI